MEQDLYHMNRGHSVHESHQCINYIKEADFHNYTIDLMFGLINATHEGWQSNLEQALLYNPPHISCYNLTLEEQTAYAKWEKDGKISQGSESTTAGTIYDGS